MVAASAGPSISGFEAGFSFGRSSVRSWVFFQARAAFPAGFGAFVSGWVAG
jgi:hypothetical protein